MDEIVESIRKLFLRIDMTPVDGGAPKDTLNKSLYAHHCIRKVRKALTKIEAACSPREGAAEHVEAIEKACNQRLFNVNMEVEAQMAG